MNISIIKNHKNLLEVYPKGDMLLEMNSENPSGDFFSLDLYDPQKNTYTKISEINTSGTTCKIFNCIYNSKDIYYFKRLFDSDEFCVFKFLSESKTDANVLSISSLGINPKEQQFIRIFILTETYILIQTENIVEAQSDSLMGHIAFTQYLYNSETLNTVIVSDENMNNNGINCIIPISPNHIMIKTGFSYFEDARYIAGKEYEAVIESVFVNMTSKFISDISLQNTSIDMELIDSTYFVTYIYRPYVFGDYILFTIVDPTNRISDSIFYNYITKEKFTCKNTNFDENDLSLGYIFNNIPYERNNLSLHTDFLNLKTMEYDFSCMGKEFIDVVGNLLILGDSKSNGKAVTQVYSYPNLDFILEEKGTYIKGCKSNDRYFLYFEN